MSKLYSVLPTTDSLRNDRTFASLGCWLSLPDWISPRGNVSEHASTSARLLSTYTCFLVGYDLSPFYFISLLFTHSRIFTINDIKHISIIVTATPSHGTDKIRNRKNSFVSTFSNKIIIIKYCNEFASVTYSIKYLM